MTRRDLTTRTTTGVPARVVHYVQPAQPAAVVLYTPAQLAARRREQQALYARWAARQQAIQERDRKVRRFWVGLGAVVGLGLLLACAVGGWLAYHALTHTVTSVAGWAVAAVLGLLVVGGAVAGGHRCITTVQHWH